MPKYQRKESKDKVYLIEKVLDERVGKRGRSECLIKWLNYPDEENSWEPSSNIMSTESVKGEPSMTSGMLNGQKPEPI